MNNEFKKGLLIGSLVVLLFFITSIVMTHSIIDYKIPKKIDYQLELINQTDVRLMDEHGETLYITTFDSIGYYIEQDNL
jgi:hypothetical protein